MSTVEIDFWAKDFPETNIRKTSGRKACNNNEFFWKKSKQKKGRI